jgi:acyl dehydratase
MLSRGRLAPVATTIHTAVTTPRYFDDIQPGDTWSSEPVAITAEEIIDFGSKYDPQPMHTDPERATRGPFGALIASGWHIAAVSMRVFVQSGGYGKTPVVGLGIDELRWQQPVKAGDVLTFTREVIEARRSASSPSHGIVRTKVTARNQRGETVMSLLTAARVATRAASGSEGSAT